MTATPKTTVEDSYAAGLACAICGQSNLFVQHLPNFPDFVTCRDCQSAFVLEDTGERVMYGKIPDSYPDTRSFALRQWVWLEAVERRARDERPPPPTAEPPEAPEDSLRMMVEEALPPQEEEPITSAPPGPDANWLAARLRVGELSAGVPIPTEPDPNRGRPSGVPLGGDTGPTDDSLPDWLRGEAAPAPQPPIAPPREAPASQPAAPGRESVPPPPPGVRAHPDSSPVPQASPGAPIAGAAEPGREGEPPPNRRHRVFLRGDRVRMPVSACAHCQRAPAPDRIPVPGSLPRTGSTGRRQATFQVPLCRDCSNRSRARSPEQGSARLMAHLVGALVGLVLVVAALALNLIPFSSGLALGLVILGAIGFVGYGFIAGILLGRAGRMPPPPDAAFVRTTLRVSGEPGAAATAFEWRNPQFAASFYQANRAAASGEPASVADPAPGS